MSQSHPSVIDEAWWQGAVIYQVYPRSFLDTTGDGIGDLPGITERLEYIQSLGVSAIWISPFFPSPMRDFGYDVADYCNVDPMFGSLDDFQALVFKAHQLGLKIIIDQVYSHTSDLHAWFQESRVSKDNSRADWYIWADAKADGSPPTNWQSVFGGPAWTWDARREQYYMHNFLSCQPDLNLHNPAVQDALLDVARFWLSRGVDGFRLDALNFIMHDPQLRDNPPAAPGHKRTRPFDFQEHLYNRSHPNIPLFLQRLRGCADGYGDTFLVAEVVGEDSDREMKLFTQVADRLHSAYGFQFLYADALRPELLKAVMQKWVKATDHEGWPAWAFSNHDTPRAPSRWAEGRDHKAYAEMTLYLLMCLRGTVFLYQGEELGLPQGEVPFERLQDPEAIANWPQTLGRDGARTPMPWTRDGWFAGFSTGEPWLPIDPRHLDLAIDVQEHDAQATIHVARRAVRLRAHYQALRTGDFHLIEASDALFVFQRGDGDEALICAFNLGFESTPWAAPEGWRIVERLYRGPVQDGALAPMAGVIAERA